MHVHCTVAPSRREILLFVQENDTRKSSLNAIEAISSIGAMVIKIPARPQDLNTTKNFIHNFKRKLRQGALNYKILNKELN